MRNLGQEEIIKNAKLPAVVIAGPGTGKTHTIVGFVAEAIKDGEVLPNKILITTFTKKAARELNTRIITRLRKDGLDTDLEDMKIGNFHSLAISFITKYRRLDDNFFNLTIIDSNMEEFIVEENLEIFTSLPHFEDFIGKDYAIATILDIFQTLINQMIDPISLRDSASPQDKLAYEIFKTYERLLDSLGLINFQLILKRFLDLLKDPVIGEKIREEIDLVVIDEYQDTNLIQEEIAINLTKNGNIIVFGDDDQALYSFRGADARNLTHFDEKFYDRTGIRASKYFLNINYRSNQVIIDKARAFMDEAKGSSKKELKSNKAEENPNTIVRARASEMDNLVMIVKLLSKKIKLGQIAFLFPSFNNSYPSILQKKFENAGIKVINRKSDGYFRREEIRLIIFILLKLARTGPINTDFRGGKMTYGQRQKLDYRNFLKEIYEDDYFNKNRGIRAFIESSSESSPISDLIYKLMGLETFKDILKDKNQARKDLIFKNISKFINLAVDYDEIFEGTKNYYQKFIFSYIFIYFKKNAIGEFDEDDVYDDAINFMTIHQSKGLEFEAVFVSSLGDYPRRDYDKFTDRFVEKDSLEKKELDFYRKYYTAFTRAKNLLVLLDNSADRRIKNFAYTLDSSSKLSSIDFKMEERKDDKKILAFTTDIDVYMTCPLKYKFIRKLSFRTKKTESLIFGSKVHNLAQYIYSPSFDKKDMTKFLWENKGYIEPVSNLLNRGFDVKLSEANYKADRDFYILQGNIDLILEDSSIMDLKTGSFDEKSLARYKNQLLTYRQLLLANGKEVGKIYLYFIEKDGLIEIKDEGFDMSTIDDVAREIVRENFDHKTEDWKACKFCPMKHFCERA
ncbi:ATP-dependent DNA helicase [Anaerococcus marasmi]|uniref:ATP-dependent DNA helicase n=1 Tax=Anaerococcus marasmi TaxID=2057797 RepID=UPI000CF899C2|nr:ATP-dependent DNA helicase [Anaerococcus marasmi]